MPEQAMCSMSHTRTPGLHAAEGKTSPYRYMPGAAICCMTDSLHIREI